MSADMGPLITAGLNLNAPVDGTHLPLCGFAALSNRAMRAALSWVLLEFAIDELGLAVNPVVIESEPRHFDRAATSAVKR